MRQKNETPKFSGKKIWNFRNREFSLQYHLNSGAVSFRPRRLAVSPRRRCFWKTNAVVLENECVRFSKRLRSFFILGAARE